MVDNCYGEFVERIEPSDVGADMIVGSLIKNPGGGLAPIGGYVAGKKELIENCAYRLTSPGLGKEVGASLGVMQSFYQWIFYWRRQLYAERLKELFLQRIFMKNSGIRLFQMQARAVMILFRQLRLAVQME